jgi:sigma-E factor negative regulatory protein RseB
LESLRLTHGTWGGEEFERLEHLDGAPREIIRHGKQLTCIQLGQRVDSLLHRHLLKAGLEGLDRYYDIQIAGEDRVAARRAVVLNIKPRDQFRFGYRLALDYDTGLLLRTEALDDGGHVRERLQFVEVEIGMPLKKEWLGDVVNHPSNKSAASSSPTAAAAVKSEPMQIDRVVEEAQMPWQPEWMPPGFVLSVAPHRATEGVMTYSDGLAVLSIFVEATKPPLPESDGRAVHGATVAYTKMTNFNGQPYLVTVVGEVPEMTAQRVASSVTWRQPAP